LATSRVTRVTPVCRCLQPFCGCRHLATLREPKAHFGLPSVRHWDNRGKFTWMEREFNACQMHVPIYLQPFPSNSTRKFKSSPFKHIFAHFGLPWVRLWDNRGKFYMDGKRIQCWSNASQHIPIYLQPFTSYSEILVGNCNFFLSLVFNAPVGDIPIGIHGKRLDFRKLESRRYHP